MVQSRAPRSERARRRLRDNNPRVEPTSCSEAVSETMRLRRSKEILTSSWRVSSSPRLRVFSMRLLASGHSCSSWSASVSENCATSPTLFITWITPSTSRSPSSSPTSPMKIGAHMTERIRRFALVPSHSQCRSSASASSTTIVSFRRAASPLSPASTASTRTGSTPSCSTTWNTPRLSAIMTQHTSAPRRSATYTPNRQRTSSRPGDMTIAGNAWNVTLSLWISARVLSSNNVDASRAPHWAAKCCAVFST
mmetsp:Transcript_6327/g.14681  ORF Transcript_6327/g.14681 Transcript_6327/m.14681 type:complete len:252 (-) Transcript_6327:502-1257(-)